MKRALVLNSSKMLRSLSAGPRTLSCIREDILCFNSRHYLSVWLPAMLLSMFLATTGLLYTHLAKDVFLVKRAAPVRHIDNSSNINVCLVDENC